MTETLIEIIKLLQGAIIVLASVAGNPHATLADKQQAIIKSNDIVAQIRVAWDNVKNCRTDAQYGRLECSNPSVSKEPIVYLEADLHKSGQIIKLKGLNRDSNAKRLGMIPGQISDINPTYFSGGFVYSTSSISGGDYLVIQAKFNSNARQGTTCTNWRGEKIEPKDFMEKVYPTQQIKDALDYNLSQGYQGFVGASYPVNCKVQTGIRNITPYLTEPIIEQEYDSISTSWVK